MCVYIYTYYTFTCIHIIYTRHVTWTKWWRLTLPMVRHVATKWPLVLDNGKGFHLCDLSFKNLWLQSNNEKASNKHQRRIFYKIATLKCLCFKNQFNYTVVYFFCCCHSPCLIFFYRFILKSIMEFRVLSTEIKDWVLKSKSTIGAQDLFSPLNRKYEEAL